MLLAGDIDPQRHDADVVGEVDAVDHEGDEVELVETRRQQLGERVLGGLHEAARDRGAGLALRALLHLGPDRFEADAVAAGRQLGEHLLHGEAPEHLGRGEVLVRGDLQLSGPIGRAHPGPADRHLAPAEGDRAVLVAVADGLAVLVVAALRPAERGELSSMIASMTWSPAPTARASRPSRSSPARLAIATATVSGTGIAAAADEVWQLFFTVVVPLLRMTWRSPEHLPAGRRQAGDRHLKIHDERDNLPTPVVYLRLLAVSCG